MMLIYLAAPIESNLALGRSFRQEIYVGLQRLNGHNCTIYDPYGAVIQHPNQDWGMVRRLHREVLGASSAVLALLAGCETWREIEYYTYISREHGANAKVYGVWPTNARQSPTAVVDIVVCKTPIDALHRILGINA